MMVSIDLPDEVLFELHQTPDEAENDARLAVAIEWFRRGAISQGRAAEIAGIARADFIAELAARNIDVIAYDPEELRRELGLV